MKNRNLYKIALQCFAVAGIVVLVCSCLSFNIADRPSTYVWPANDPAANWCGAIGAFFAYYLMYYIGPGVLVVLGALACGLVANLAGKKISQPILRFIGMVLLTAGVSTSVYLLWPHTAGSFPRGNGGTIGVAAGVFLKQHFASLGTFLVVMPSVLVGAILLADALVLNALRWCGLGFVRVFGMIIPAFSVAKRHSAVMGRIWTKLSERMQPEETEDDEEPSLADTIAQLEEEESDDEEDEPVELAEMIKQSQPEKNPCDETICGYVPKSYEDYELPPRDLLFEPEPGFASVQEKIIKAKALALEKVLNEFGISAEVAGAEPGPTITMFELSLAAGIKVSQISTLANDIARALGAGAVRIVAPIPGKHTIGIEVPNSQKEMVRLRDLMDRSGRAPKKMHLPLFLGKDSSNEALVSDLAAMPHLLIAGTTGSGKSVCINSIIVSLLMLRRPDEVKLILVDPKMVEMAAFSKIPHLMCPIVTETNRAAQIFEWATTKMDERYALLSEAGVRNIGAFNKLGAEEVIRRLKPNSPEEEAKIPKRLPYFVIIVDELADLMMTAAKEIEACIVRLAQKSRAVGIHLVLSTQRPQATVVTGLIKANMPARVSFRVASRMDSRIILDQNGSETLLGHGDMLFLKPGTSDLERAQGTFVDDAEVKAIVKHLAEIAEPQFHPELVQLNQVDMSMGKKDDMFNEAVRVVLDSKRGSVSLLQRRLGVGYARASRMIEMMAAGGILGEYKGSQAREVMMTMDEWNRLQKQVSADAEGGYADLDEDEYEKEQESIEEADVDYATKGGR